VKCGEKSAGVVGEIAEEMCETSWKVELLSNKHRVAWKESITSFCGGESSIYKVRKVRSS
jgi:hypothetical protein